MQTVEIRKIVRTYGNRRETIFATTEAEFIALANEYNLDGWRLINNPTFENATHTLVGFVSPDFDEARDEPWAYYWQLDQYWVPASWASKVA